MSNLNQASDEKNMDDVNDSYLSNSQQILNDKW